MLLFNTEPGWDEDYHGLICEHLKVFNGVSAEDIPNIEIPKGYDVCDLNLDPNRPVFCLFDSFVCDNEQDCVDGTDELMW